MSTETDASIHGLVDDLIPAAKKRILRALERPREDVESELATFADSFMIKEGLGKSKN